VLTLIIIGLIVIAARVVGLYLWPYAPCRKCQGSSRNPGSKKERYGQCGRCGGTGRRTRLGANTVHRGRVALAERRRKEGSK
jgi:hypothetical protein